LATSRISNSSRGLFGPISPSIVAPFAALAALLCSIGQRYLFACDRVSSLLFAEIAVSLAVKNVCYSVCLDALYKRIEWIRPSTFAYGITLKNAH
jgi:hypothetical protein